MGCPWPAHAARAWQSEVLAYDLSVAFKLFELKSSGTADIPSWLLSTPGSQSASYLPLVPAKNSSWKPRAW